MNRTITATLVTLLAATGLSLTGSATAHAANTLTRPLHAAIERLPVARETRAGYDRDKFTHWVDADGDCQDTRDEVLAAESLVPTRGCDIQRGRWRSAYDGVMTRQSAASTSTTWCPSPRPGTPVPEPGTQPPGRGMPTTSSTAGP